MLLCEYCDNWKEDGIICCKEFYGSLCKACLPAYIQEVQDEIRMLQAELKQIKKMYNELTKE